MLFDFAWMADSAGVSLFFVAGCGVLLNVGGQLRNPVRGCSLWCLTVGVCHTGLVYSSCSQLAVGAGVGTNFGAIGVSTSIPSTPKNP